MKKLKKFFGILFVVIFLLVPIDAGAQTLPFGGMVAFSVPCTCSFNLWIFFAPMYPAPVPFPYSGALVYTPGISFLHPLFLIGVPTKWHLGDYVPGVQACFIGAPPFCVPLPSWGHIFRVGTSG